MYIFTIKNVFSGHSKRAQKIVFQNGLSLNAGQKYCRISLVHFAILLAFIKLPFSIRPLFGYFLVTAMTGFTVFGNVYLLPFKIYNGQSHPY